MTPPATHWRQVFLITSISKLLGRNRGGLWRVPDGASYSYVLGATNNPHGQELLGWWIVPISLAVSLVLGWLTWRFGIFSVRLMRLSAQRARA